LCEKRSKNVLLRAGERNRVEENDGTDGKINNRKKDLIEKRLMRGSRESLPKKNVIKNRVVQRTPFEIERDGEGVVY
jgi:hypothetical protein